jgi:chromosome segregation ATPase
MSRFNSFLLTVLLFESIYIHVEGEFNNVQDLEQFVIQEFKHFKENEKELNHKISTLEKENEDKGTQLKKLEEELKYLKKERELDQRTRRQSRTLVAFTAYKAQHIHNITKEQKIVYENVSKHLKLILKVKYTNYCVPYFVHALT